MPSYDSVNFSLRSGKNVERKLVFESLSAVREDCGLSSYRYIGMGSLWFVDFILAHKILGISDLVSIERDAADRARFNKPYKCITVEHGESTKVLPEINLGAKPAIIWLDYDDIFLGSSTLRDIEIVCSSASANTFLLITINADNRQLKGIKKEGTEITPSEALRDYAGDLVPPELKQASLNALRFPTVLADIVLAQMHHATIKRAGGVTFLPIWNLTYRDNARMITVGGILATEERAAAVNDKLQMYPLFDSLGSAAQFPILVPPLTLKEKMALDGLLPCEQSLRQRIRDNIDTLGFDLADEQLDAYERFYRHYPVFGELQL